MKIDRLEDLREIRMRCTKTGTYAHWTLTEARGNTFVDVELEVIRSASETGSSMPHSASSTFGAGSTNRWRRLKEAAAKPTGASVSDRACRLPHAHRA